MVERADCKMTLTLTLLCEWLFRAAFYTTIGDLRENYFDGGFIHTTDTSMPRKHHTAIAPSHGPRQAFAVTTIIAVGFGLSS